MSPNDGERFCFLTVTAAKALEMELFEVIDDCGKPDTSLSKPVFIVDPMNPHDESTWAQAGFAGRSLSDERTGSGQRRRRIGTWKDDILHFCRFTVGDQQGHFWLYWNGRWERHCIDNNEE
jgi:hypothetical protein